MFFNLIYNEQHAPADEWFGARGWAADATPLPDYLSEVGRPDPASDPEAGSMIGLDQSGQRRQGVSGPSPAKRTGASRHLSYAMLTSRG